MEIHTFINGIYTQWSNKSLTKLWSISNQFWKIGLFLGFSNNLHVDSLYRFRESVVEEFKLEINNLIKHKYSEE